MQERKVGLWLFCCAFMVVCMIVVGGITRLSQSGLSIVEWKPITGTIPPTSRNAWDKEFELYKKFPEYKEKNFNFTLEEFKEIYMVEYYHRLMGRFTGLVFLFPLIYFVIKRDVTKKDTIFLSTVFALLVCQGFMGWYMVKSGLVNDPDVSHYRLASHLMLAFLIYFLIAWKGLCFWQRTVKPVVSSNLKHAILLFSICVLQIFFGALVAGLDAGLLYNSFPLMGGKMIPDEVYNSFVNLRIFSDPVTVQFLHRVFGITLLLYSFYFFYLINKGRMKKIIIPLRIAVLAIFAQFLLGVLTLIYKVPMNLAIIHQFGAIIVFTNLLFIMFILRYANSFNKQKNL
jgi:heme a synthase